MNEDFDRLRAGLADIAGEVTVVDLRDRALRTSRQIGVRRAVVGGLAVAAVLAIGAGTAFAVLPTRHDPGPGGTPTPSQSASASPVPSGSPATSTAPSAPDPRTIDLRNATIDMPGWAAAFKNACPAGPRHFVDGKAVTGNNGGGDLGYRFRLAPPVYGDLDGEPGDEVVVSIGCFTGGSTDPSMLLALKPMPGGTVRTLGLVISMTPVPLAYDEETVEIQNGVALVEVMGEYRSNGDPRPKQLRGYRYGNGRFSQVTGATTFPAPVTDLHAIDLRNTTLWVPAVGPCNTQCTDGGVVRFVNGTGRAVTRGGTTNDQNVRHVNRYRIDGTGFMTTPGQPDIALVTVTRTGDDGSTATAVLAVVTGGDGALTGWPVLRVGVDGVTGIVSASGSDGVARIVVKTARGQETRSYRRNANQQTWDRVS